MTVSFSKFRQLLVHCGHRCSPLIQWSGGEVHAEALAPDRYGTVLVKVEIGRQFVVLVSDVTLQSANFHKSRLFHRFAVAGILVSYEINVHIRAVGGLKVCKAENTFPVRKLVDTGISTSIVGDA